MRVLLFTGKGGVGKTSVAAATAVRGARNGLRTLIMSTDPAHSLADALDTDLGPEPREVAERLYAEQIDARRRLEAHWRQIQEYLIALLDWGGVGEVEAEELSVLPGLDEVFSLIDVRRHVDEGAWDLLVVDCAPTAETLRLLSLPDALGWYLERVFPVQRRVANVVRPVLGKVTTMPLPQDHVLGAIDELHRNLRTVREILADGERTSIRLVVNAERMVVAEAQRTFTYLNLFAYHVDAVVVNRLLPSEVDDAYFARWKDLQAEHLRSVRAGFGGIPVLTAPLLRDEPIGAEALAELGRHVYGAHDVAAVLHRTEPLRIDPADGGHVLDVALPFVDKRELDVFRRGDELHVRVGTFNRTIVLPAILRRADVVAARVVADSLRVTFAPTITPADAGWPQAAADS